METSLPAVRDSFDNKFDKIVRWYHSKDPNAKLPKPLEEQLERWTLIYGLISKPKNQFKRDSALINAISKAYPDLSDRTIRHALADTRRFFASVESPNLAFERVMLIGYIKDTMRRAKARNDIKGENAAAKNLITVLGADKPEEVVENRTIINILNYNPAELGGEVMPEDKLQAMIKRMLADDEKKKESMFDDFEDVTPPA